MVSGLITDIERYAINDGYGVRTTVFLKGCPLRCRWCSNPETQELHQEMMFFPDKCIGCGSCIRQCARGALKDDLTADREICASCYRSAEPFACTKQCYPGCRRTAG